MQSNRGAENAEHVAHEPGSPQRSERQSLGRKTAAFLADHVPGLRRAARMPRQLLGVSPFLGDIQPTRVRLFHFGSGRPSLPFPHPWNYDRPIEILEAYFWEADAENGSGRHNRYLDVPGFAPVLVTRDPGVIRAVTTETGEREGQFDRDTLPSKGIARATGSDTLLYANGSLWRRQRKLAASPFGRTSLFQPEIFRGFEQSFAETVRNRLKELRKHLASTGQTTVRIRLEPEIKAVMLEMLANNFFGADIPYQTLADSYVPAMERVIDHIVHDTVANPTGIPWRELFGISARQTTAKADYAVFERLTDLVLAARHARRGLWKQFKSDAPDETLRSNIKVFLAGALEATTSFAAWTLSHLARNPAAQEKVHAEVKDVRDYSPDNLDEAKYLGHVLEETLRLTPSLYFLPRKATADTWIETADGRKLLIPRGTHILLDVWHSNRHEDHWGREASGYPATEFVPERWASLAAHGRSSKDNLHFGFGTAPEFVRASTWVSSKSLSLSARS